VIEGFSKKTPPYVTDVAIGCGEKISEDKYDADPGVVITIAFQ
jgi:hypothetical protein